MQAVPQLRNVFYVTLVCCTAACVSPTSNAPIIAKYNGKLLLRVRPQVDAFIENSIDKPYEIHLVEFEGEQDFINFMHDEDRKKFLHLKEQSIELSVLYKGGVKL